MSTTRQKIEQGLVQIKFHSDVNTHLRPCFESPDLEIVKTVYINRKFSRLQEAKGVVIPIHGIRTHADWMPHLSLLATTSGWAIAPYIYGYTGVSILRDETEKKKVVEGFRDWLTVVRSKFSGPISIISHSFGTYVLARYLRDAKDISVGFDAVVLCGSILNHDHDWSDHFESGKIGYLLNTISEKDEWVRFMPQEGISLLANDVLFGSAGYRGFTKQHARLYEIRSSLLQHNNIFKTDVILSQWLPFLEMAKGSQYKYSMKHMLRN